MTQAKADVLILGAGVIGVASAYYLAKQGARVAVIERQSGAALETSFANAGQVSPGYSTPWAAPKIPQKALKWIFQKHAPLAIRPDGTPFQLSWIGKMYANCNAKAYAINKARMVRVAEFSRDCLVDLRADTGIHYDENTRGTLQLFRDEKQLQAVQKDIKVLQDMGVAHTFIDNAQELSRVEPALEFAKSALAGGLLLPNDETGDCYMLTTRLAEHCQKMGVQFMYDTHIERVVVEQDAIVGVDIIKDNQKSRVCADNYVLALGSYTRNIALPLALDLPVYPVKGYSLTVPIVDATKAPVSTVLDETYKIALTRLGNRIRVGGMAELAGFDLSLNQERRDTLEMVTDDLFSGGDLAQGKFWTGLRPMTPDGTPIIGRTRYRNVFLNTGHGTLGFTMAFGSGQILADIILNHAPKISLEGLDLGRYR